MFGSLIPKEQRSRCPSTRVTMVRMQETRRTSTASRASPSAGTARSRGPRSPTSSPAGTPDFCLYCTASCPANGADSSCQGLFTNGFLNLSVQAEEDEGDSVRVPGVRGRRSRAAEDVHQRTQPPLLPQRQLRAAPASGDGSGQRGRERPGLAQREDRQGERQSLKVSVLRVILLLVNNRSSLTSDFSDRPAANRGIH